MTQQTSQPFLNIVSISRSASDLIPTYQSTRRFIHSLAQPSKHILVFDSLSTRVTFNSVVRVEPSVIQLVQEYTGISHAFNAATQYLCPGFVLYLNAGDVFNDLSSTDSAQLLSHLSTSIFDLIVCKSFLLPSSVIPQPYVKFAYSPFRLPFILARLPHQATFINTKHVQAIPYLPSLRIRMDYCFFYTLLQAPRHIRFLDIFLSSMSPGGTSSNLSAGYAEELSIHRSFDRYRLIHHLRIAFTRALKKCFY